MARFLSLHEAPPPDGDLCKKYNVPSYEDYKAWARTTGRQAYEAGRVISYPATKNLSPTQVLAFSVVKALALFSEKPRFLVINRELIIRFTAEEGHLPLEFEGIPLVVDAESIFTVTWIL